MHDIARDQIWDCTQYLRLWQKLMFCDDESASYWCFVATFPYLPSSSLLCFQLPRPC